MAWLIFILYVNIFLSARLVAGSISYHLIPERLRQNHLDNASIEPSSAVASRANSIKLTDTFILKHPLMQAGVHSYHVQRLSLSN